LAKVVPKKSININDTSLFAELVKGKHKREKVLKEILLSTDAKEDSKVINVDALDGNDSKPLPASTNGDITDIPIPPSSNGILSENLLLTSEKLPNLAIAPPPPPPEAYPSVIKKNKATELPMPPGIIVPSELRTPSPPKEDYLTAGPSKKMRLLDMPMPPMISGTEDLSNDENDSMFGKKSQKGSVKGNGTAKITRPKIIMRRRSDNAVGNWGERCVDVFQIMAQIGEGKLIKNIHNLNS
jgi:cyclin-dependent kinase 12/13